MRILLFILMQVAVLILVSIVGSVLMTIFGVRISSGTYTGLLIMCAIMGCVGSVISLFMSKWMCKRAYGVQVITAPRNAREQFLLNTIAQQARREGFAMPEVGIYESNDMNAFATGASKDGALVAVSSALLYSMSEDELRGVLGHEMSHIANGDMVTMCLLQGVLNTFVYFFSYLVAMAVSQVARNNDEEGGNASSFLLFHLVNTVFQIIFGILANIILMWFSRHREYRADAGSAALEGRDRMIAALQALQRQPTMNQPGQFQALCINGGGNLSELFMSHPPLAKRIAALRQLNG